MMDDELCGYDRAARALEHIRRAAGDLEPRVAVVLGSGLGSVADEVEDARILPAAEIPGWPRSTAPGHAGRVVMGTLEGCPVILLQGRVHCYEGYSMQDVTFPVRVLGMMGVRQYVATNASGGVNPELAPGDIAAVRDHINLMGANPLVGPSEPRWNVRFPDMTHAYSPRLLELLDRAAWGGPRRHVHGARGHRRERHGDGDRRALLRGEQGLGDGGRAPYGGGSAPGDGGVVAFPGASDSGADARPGLRRPLVRSGARG